MITRKFKATQKLVDAIGKEWAGEYVIRQLTSTELLNIGDEVIEDARKQGKNIFEVPAHYQNERLVYKCVTLDGKDIKYGTMPSKLMEILMRPVFELNSLTPQERQEVFLQPC